jgi:hypothetical protein
MSIIAKIIGIVIIVGGFLAFAHTTSSYNVDIKKEGVNVLTSETGKKIWEHWGIEAVVIVFGLSILALGIKLGRSP